MKKKILFVAACITGSTAFGQSSQQEDSIKTLDKVVITATKYPTKQSNTGKVVSVVTHEQIEKSAGKDLAQLLNEQTGLTVSGSFSNPGKDKSIFLRGASSNYTLILLDGIPLNDPSGTGGTFDIRLIPLEQIERIEILKGSQSTLYGSNAIAGVINIISKKPAGKQLAGNALLSYGSYNTFKGNVNLTRKIKSIEYDLNYEYFDTKGISEAKDLTGNKNFDKDGFTRQSFQGNIGFIITPQIKVAPYYRFSEFKGNYDAGAFTDGPQKYNASLVNSGFISTFNYTRGIVTANYGYDLTKLSYNGYLLGGKFNHAEAYVNHNFSDHLQLLAGINYQTFHLPQPDTTNGIFSSYASLIYHQSGFTMEAGSRYNKHNRYGDNFTYSFNPSYLFKQRLKLFADISSGYRAPAINELFGAFGANPGLKPETSNTIEGGLQAWSNKKLSALATYFSRDIRNVIIYEYPKGYMNRDRQKDHGIELEFQYVPDSNWNFKASYAFVDGQITQRLLNKDTTFHNLIRRPKHTLNFFAGYQVDRNFYISTSVQYLSKRNDVFYNPANFYSPEPKVLDAYLLLNAYAEYKILNNVLMFFIDAKNLTNKKNYAEVYGYNVQGFTINAGARFKL